tara:strand:- start:288 stop:1235 length:948 start_codon:yes stop_codon:yes gene_type:complete
MIKITKPKFWDYKKISLISILFLPLSLITLLIIFLKKKLIKKKTFKIPVICVGNIYIGGTGKTPASIVIAKELSNIGIKTAILRKFYSNHSDEHSQIKNYFNNLIICKNRAAGIKEAENKGYETVILDDGLQDYGIKKNLSIVCFHQNQLIGNGLILPSGPLRENLEALKNTNIILINGKKDKNFEEKLLKINKNLEFFYAYYKPENIDKFKNNELLALAAIANPENFFMMLEKNNLNVSEKLVYPDHYKFSKIEIQKIIDKAHKKKLKLIMTEKDFFKFKELNFSQINYLKVSFQILNKERLINKIKKIYDKIY